MSNQLGRPEGRLHTRSVTPHMSPKIRSAAMRVVKAGTKGGSYGDVSVCLTIGALGLSVFHRPGRNYRPEALSPNRVRNDTIPSGERVVGQVCLVELVLSLGNEIQQGRKKNMIRKLVVSAILGILVTASGAMAQEGHWQEISAQGTGFFTKDSSGNGINQHATDAGGFLLSYRYHFNRWLAADASYGYARNTQQNFTSSGPFSVQ